MSSMQYSHWQILDTGTSNMLSACAAPHSHSVLVPNGQHLLSLNRQVLMSRHTPFMTDKDNHFCHEKKSGSYAEMERDCWVMDITLSVGGLAWRWWAQLVEQTPLGCLDDNRGPYVQSSYGKLFHSPSIVFPTLKISTE